MVGMELLVEQKPVFNRTLGKFLENIEEIYRKYGFSSATNEERKIDGMDFIDELKFCWNTISQSLDPPLSRGKCIEEVGKKVGQMLTMEQEVIGWGKYLNQLAFAMFEVKDELKRGQLIIWGGQLYEGVIQSTPYPILVEDMERLISLQKELDGFLRSKSSYSPVVINPNKRRLYTIPIRILTI